MSCISCKHHDQWNEGGIEVYYCNLYNEHNPKRCEKYEVKEGFVDLNRKREIKPVWRCL